MVRWELCVIVIQHAQWNQPESVNPHENEPANRMQFSPGRRHPFPARRSPTIYWFVSSLLVCTGVAAPPPRRLPRQHLPALLPQRHPDPEPADHLDEGEGEEDAVLERIAAPARGGVHRIVDVRRRVGEAAPGRVGIERRGGGEEEGVDGEREGDDETEGGWTETSWLAPGSGRRGRERGE